VNAAWRAWIAATKHLFWASIDAFVTLIVDRERVNRGLAALMPKRTQDVFDAGFALFRYDLNSDYWCGVWFRPTEPRTWALRPADEHFQVLGEWSEIPWHPVTLGGSNEQFRAVDLEYCRAHLRLYGQARAA
jgi:hypothetical protein